MYEITDKERGIDPSSKSPEGRGRRTASRPGGVLVLYGSGHPHEGQYPRQIARRPDLNENQQPPWTPLEHEIAVLNWYVGGRSWVPTSVDFQAEAIRQGGGVGVGSYEAFKLAIRRRRDLQRVLFFGHGSPQELRFGTNNAIRGASQQDDLSSSFLPGGGIYLYACSTGYDIGLLQNFAQNWRVNVFGRQTGVRWRLNYTGRIHQNPRVTYRGIWRSDSDIAHGSTNLPVMDVHASP